MRMVEVRENPHRVVTISKAERTGDDELQTSYQYEGT